MLLNDDDTAIRKQAAEVIAEAFNNGESICQEEAEKLLWHQMIERYHDSLDFATMLLARLANSAEIGAWLVRLGRIQCDADEQSVSRPS